MVRAVQGHHLPAIVIFIIPFREPSPVIQVHEHFPVFRKHFESVAPLFQIKVRIFPVHGCDPCHILWLFHAPFDLKGIDPRIHKVRYDLQGTDILWAQVILLFPVHGVRQPARLGALSPVAAPAPDHTAQKALPGITVAERSVDKALDLQPGLLPDLPYLPKRELPRRHHPCDALLFEKLCPVRSCHRHLCTCMEIHPRENFSYILDHAGILDNDRIQPRLIERRQIIVKVSDLRVL